MVNNEENIMKILYFTDTHIRGNNPASRKDIYVDSLELKIKEIIELVDELDVDFILHGGDIFDRPDIAISVVNKFVKLFNQFKVPFYFISGNHDIYGHNPETVHRTTLSLLDIVDVMNMINKDDIIILEKNGLKVQLTGQPYVYDIDGDNKLNYYSPRKRLDNVDYAIHMVHGLLIDKHFIKGIPYTLIEDIVDTKADITLSGHYHSGFETTNIEGKYFINPGSLVRISNTKKEIKRKPKVILLELNKNINVQEIYLKSAKPGIEILDRDKLEESAYQSERIFQFKQGIDSAINFKKLDINEVLMEVSNADNVEEEVKKEALRRISEVQMKGLAEN